MKRLIISIASTLAIAVCTFQSSVAGNLPLQTERDILSALIKNNDVLLTDAKHCKDAGAFGDEKTIGEYFSGFWAYHTEKKGKQWIDIRTRELKNEHLFILIQVMVTSGDDVLSQGVSFEMDSNKKVLRDTFACAGSG